MNYFPGSFFIKKKKRLARTITLIQDESGQLNSRVANGDPSNTETRVTLPNYDQK